MANTSQQFNIAVSDETLDDLKQRLSLAKFASQLEATDGNDWAYGVPVRELKRLVAYWKDGYDWRKAERELNELPNFRTKIDVDGFDPIDLHFVHQVSPVEDAIPLLFSHGWPGSFIEIKKLLPLLKGGNENPAFHVVAPSLPNFGFSSGVTKKGFTLDKYAETLHKLMIKLGYTEYVTQGGDWGWSILRAVGLLYPNHCKASHFNMIPGQQPTWSKHPILALQHATTAYTERESQGFKRNKWFEEEAYGYNLLQSTKPQTVSSALADSPVALLGWIYEKLHDWTDDYPWSDDEILTWISIYWFSTAGPEANVRIYHEATHPAPQSHISTQSLRKYIPHVKLGLAHFPREIMVVPDTWAATLGPVALQSHHSWGGHFAAWERPDAIAADLQSMYKRGGPCYEIVSGKSGYST